MLSEFLSILNCTKSVLVELGQGKMDHSVPVLQMRNQDRVLLECTLITGNLLVHLVS